MLLAVKDGKNKRMFGAGTKQDNVLPVNQRRVGRPQEDLGVEEGGCETADTIQPPSAAISEGAGVKELNGLEGQGQ